MDNYVITIAREYGSGGKTIGKMLADHLGIPCYDMEILRMASDDSGINEQLFAKSDEQLKRPIFFKPSRSVYTDELIPPGSKNFVSEENLDAGRQRVLRHYRKMCRLCAEGSAKCAESLCTCAV